MHYRIMLVCPECSVSWRSLREHRNLVEIVIQNHRDRSLSAPSHIPLKPLPESLSTYQFFRRVFRLSSPFPCYAFIFTYTAVANTHNSRSLGLGGYSRFSLYFPGFSSPSADGPAPQLVPLLQHTVPVH